MKNCMFVCTSLAALVFALALVAPANAHVKLGTGNASLLGGDLTDPEDDVVDSGNYAGNGSEEFMKPDKANWVTMKSAPNSPPDKPPHQLHSYHNWQNTPPCAIFLNNPEGRKWYLGFLDGGNGGPTEAAPYYCAVELKEPVALTHFTVTCSPDMPGRDPRQWAIQGSDTGKENDWTDIYKCDAADRSGTPFQEGGRAETFLFSSFTSGNMGRICTAKDAKKVSAKLAGEKIQTKDFPVQTKAYKWFRIVIYSCFNANSLTYEDFNRPPGFALAQVEFFGGAPAAPAPKPADCQPRTWTNRKGDKVEAKFVKIDGVKVYLAKADGKTTVIQWAALSDEDKDYVRTLVETPD